MTAEQTELNMRLYEWATDEYDGFAKLFTIPGSWLTDFTGTRVDFELTLQNCVGDRESYRNFAEITNEDI